MLSKVPLSDSLFNPSKFTLGKVSHVVPISMVYNYICTRPCHPFGISWGWTRVVRSARTRDLDIGIDRYKDGHEGRHEQTPEQARIAEAGFL